MFGCESQPKFQADLVLAHTQTMVTFIPLSYFGIICRDVTTESLQIGICRQATKPLTQNAKR